MVNHSILCGYPHIKPRDHTRLTQKYCGFVMVSWMHNTVIDINDIDREYNYREHRGTQRIDSKTLCSLLRLFSIFWNGFGKPQRAQRTQRKQQLSVPSASSVVKSGGFYRLCGIDSTTTEILWFLPYGIEHVR